MDSKGNDSKGKDSTWGDAEGEDSKGGESLEPVEAAIRIPRSNYSSHTARGRTWDQRIAGMGMSIRNTGPAEMHGYISMADGTKPEIRRKKKCGASMGRRRS